MKLLIRFVVGLIAVGLLTDEHVIGAEKSKSVPELIKALRTPLFSGDEIKEYAAFASKFQNATNGVSKFLWTRFSAKTKNLITDTNTTSGEGKSAFADEFNRLILGPSIYEAQRFSEIELSEETKGLTGQKSDTVGLIRLNRTLLDEAFPNDLIKYRPPENRDNSDAKLSRRDAVEKLGEMGAAAKSAVPALMCALDDRDQQVWFHSVMALARIGPDAEEAIPALIPWLDNSRNQRGRDAQRRQVWYRTAFALGRIGPAAIPSLVKALDSSQTSIRAGAAKALGWMGPAAKEAIPNLVAKLNDSETDVRQQTAEALGQIGVTAVPALIQSLSSAETLARSGAAMALGSIGSKAKDAAPILASIADKESDHEVRANAIEALSKAGYDSENFVPLLLRALKVENQGVRHAAINALLTLPNFEKTVVPPVLDLFQHGDLTVKEHAAYVLGRVGPSAKAAVPSLINAINTLGEDPPIFPFTEALVQIGPPAVPALIESLEKQNIGEVNPSHWTVRCVTAIGEPAISALIQSLENKSPSVRLGAIEVLHAMKASAKTSAAPLLNLVHDPVPEVRSGTLLALGVIEPRVQTFLPKIVEALKDQSPLVRSAAASVLADVGSDAKLAVAPLIGLIKDSDLSVRKNSAKALGAIGSGADAAVPSLTEALKENEATLRVEFIQSLGKIGSASASAVPRLLEFVKDGHPEIRRVLFKCLGNIGSAAKAALPALNESVKDADANARACAVTAIAKIESDAKALLPVLVEAVSDDSPAVRKVAVEALGKLGEAADEAVPRLFDLLKSDEDRLVALDSLRQIKVKSVSLLIDALTNSETTVRLFACEALGRLGSKAKEAMQALQKAEKDDYDIVKRQAQRAVKRIEDELAKSVPKS